MKKLFGILSFRDFIILAVGNISIKVLNRLRYFSKYLPLQKAVIELVNQKYTVGSKKGLIYVKSKKLAPEYKYLLRPFTSDIKVFKQVIEQKEYLPLINLITDHGAEDKIKNIVDAGSNIGLTSLFFNEYFPQAKIIAIEAEKSNVNQQIKNISVNALSNRITVLYNALWKDNTECLYISDDFRDGDSWAKTVTTKNTKQSAYVKPVTLSDIIHLIYPADIIDILKIDIEGAESELFKNDEFVSLLKTNVRYIAIEIHDEFKCRKNIHAVLVEVGFAIKDEGETTIGYNKNM